MKKIYKTLMIFSVIGMIITSCKKDSDNNPASIGNFTLVGDSYSTPYCYIGQSKNEFYITFSDASTVKGLEDETRHIELTLVIIPPGGSLVNGTYIGDPAHQKNLIEAFVRLGTGVNETQWTITDTFTGSITLTKNNNVYDISYTFLARKDGVPAGEKEIAGRYKGVVTFIE